MYGKNVANFLALIVSDGAVAPNPDDDIASGRGALEDAVAVCKLAICKIKQSRFK